MSVPRWITLGLVLACVFLMGSALYMEHIMGLEPCPLCMMQRLAVIGVGAIALLAFLHAPAGVGLRIYGALITLAGAAGAGLAARQLWLQSLPPDQVPACGPGVDYMMDILPLFDVLLWAMQGTGDCAKVDWTFLGLSIAGWTFPLFLIMAACGVYLLLAPHRQRPQ